MITNTRINIAKDFKMHSPTDYMAIVYATVQLCVQAMESNIPIDQMSISTSASDGFGSVSLFYDYPLTKDHQ